MSRQRLKKIFDTNLFSNPKTNAIGFGRLDFSKKKRTIDDILKRAKIFEILSRFQPFLAGSYPIRVEISSSDVDILCEASLEEFTIFCKKKFSKRKNFSISEKQFTGVDSIVVRFSFSQLHFELFAQDMPVEKQKAFIHLRCEEKLLNIYGEELRETVIKYKRNGYGTEKSFALSFGIQTDPYHFIESIYTLEVPIIRRKFRLMK